MSIVAHVRSHARVRRLYRTEHGHDGVVGGDHVRSTHPRSHQLVQRLELSLARVLSRTTMLEPGTLSKMRIKQRSRKFR